MEEGVQGGDNAGPGLEEEGLAHDPRRGHVAEGLDDGLDEVVGSAWRVEHFRAEARQNPDFLGQQRPFTKKKPSDVCYLKQLPSFHVNRHDLPPVHMESRISRRFVITTVSRDGSHGI